MKRLLMSGMVVVLMLFTVNPGVFAHTDGNVNSLSAPPLTMQINGSVVEVPADMDVIEGQVMVPLRWAAEQLGADSVQWDSATRTVTIKTPQDFYNMEKLTAYYRGLQTGSPEEEKLLCPLPDRVKNLHLSNAVPNRAWILELEQFKPAGRISTHNCIYICITSEDGSYKHDAAVYSIENHQGRYYLPMDWLEHLFKATVNYNETTNILSIQTPDREKIKTEIALIENTLMPASADEAINLWGRGEQIRNGALQYAALSPQLRQEADKSSSVRQTYWATGFSSPWAGPITITNREKLSATKFEYTLSFPELTSDPLDTTIATEKMVVEKLLYNGKEGWFITQLLQSSGYGVIEGLYKNNSLYLSADKVSFPLPADWSLEQSNQEIIIEDNQGCCIGAIEELGGYFLPNHRDILNDKKLASGWGESHLLVLLYQSPAASEIQESWQEVHAMIPLKSQHWLDISVKVSSKDNVEELQKILENAIMGAAGEATAY